MLTVKAKPFTEEKQGLGLVRKVRKGLQILRRDGAAEAFRQFGYNLHYHRFQRLRMDAARKQLGESQIIALRSRPFELHPCLNGISEELLLFGVHEPETTEAYLERLSPGDHVIDVGSNIGYYVLSTNDVIGESGRILGFEPVPSVHEILLRNVGRLKQNRADIQIFPWAIGDRNDTVHFYESEIPNWGSLIRSERLSQNLQTQVQMMRLDDVIQATPEFLPKALRLDVEGAELMVLAGAEDLIRTHKPILCIEFHMFLLPKIEVLKTLLGLKDVGYNQGILIDRIWDQPWISKSLRKRRCWKESIDGILARLGSPKDELRVFTLILET